MRSARMQADLDNISPRVDPGNTAALSERRLLIKRRSDPRTGMELLPHQCCEADRRQGTRAGPAWRHRPGLAPAPVRHRVNFGLGRSRCPILFVLCACFSRVYFVASRSFLPIEADKHILDSSHARTSPSQLGYPLAIQGRESQYAHNSHHVRRRRHRPEA
jgi:hypothetical protein